MLHVEKAENDKLIYNRCVSHCHQLKGRRTETFGVQHLTRDTVIFIWCLNTLWIQLLDILFSGDVWISGPWVWLCRHWQMDCRAVRYVQCIIVVNLVQFLLPVNFLHFINFGPVIHFCNVSFQSYTAIQRDQSLRSTGSALKKTSEVMVCRPAPTN